MKRLLAYSFGSSVEKVPNKKKYYSLRLTDNQILSKSIKFLSPFSVANFAIQKKKVGKKQNSLVQSSCTRSAVHLV